MVVNSCWWYPAEKGCCFLWGILAFQCLPMTMWGLLSCKTCLCHVVMRRILSWSDVLHLLQEVRRIKEEHPDDSKCIANNRVKGRLKVTRAFGAGFLKQVSRLCQLWYLYILLIKRLSFECWIIIYHGHKPFWFCLHGDWSHWTLTHVSAAQVE